MLRPRALPWLLLPFLVAGCGGSSHHSSNSGSGTSTDTIGPQITLVWPVRGRDFTAPGTATIARVVFPGAGLSGADLGETLTRPTGTDAFTKTYQLGIGVHPGRHLLRIDFLADTNSGIPLATTSLNVQVTDRGELRTLDGKSLGTVTYGSNITGLTIAADQSVEVGQSFDPTVTATTNGGVVALAPNSVALALTSGSDFLKLGPDGSITGIAAGIATLTASADGVTSSSATVTVMPAPIAARSVSLVTTDILLDSTRSTFWVATGSAVASLDPATGKLGTSIGLGAVPNTLALSDDGTTLYASLRSLGTVRRVDLTTNNAAESFSLPSSGFGGAGYASDIAIQPGSVSTLAIVRQDANDSGYDGPAIYDNGVARPNALGIYAASRSLWTASNRLLAYPATYGGIGDLNVSTQGVTLEQTVSTQADLSHRLVRAGGRIYATNGLVLDEGTLSSVGSFTLPTSPLYSSIFAGPAVDSARKLAYFVEISYSGSGARLHAYDTDTFAEVSNRRISGLTVTELPFNGFDTRLSLVEGRLAFRLSDQIVILDGVSNL